VFEDRRHDVPVLRPQAVTGGAKGWFWEVGSATDVGARQGGDVWGHRPAPARILIAMPPRRCYIASPLGFTEAGRDYYERVYLPALAAVVEPIDPWSLATGTPPGASDRQRALTIGRANAEAIRSCELLVAQLDGQEPDSGTVAELGYGAALGLRCYGLRSDLRQSGEPGVTVNLQVETFVVDSGGAMVATLEELVAALRGDG
jgi:nucleoside 2-deoxyribosyltransferase